MVEALVSFFIKRNEKENLNRIYNIYIFIFIQK